MIAVGSGAYTVMTTVGSVALPFFKCYALYSMYEAAFSDILCLKTFRHGTSPYAAAKIAWTGPDRSLAGKGGEANYIELVCGEQSYFAATDQERKAFYVLEDVNTNDRYPGLSLPQNYLFPKLAGKQYAFKATFAFFSSMIPLPKSLKVKIISNVSKVICYIDRYGIFPLLSIPLWTLCPTVKFHINPNRVEIPDERPFVFCPLEPRFQIPSKPAVDSIEFHRDTYGGPGALWTKHQLSVWDIGLLGVITNGINRDIFKRINENRGQFLWGVAQLVTAVAFTAVFFPGLIPGGWVVVAGVASIVALERFGRIGYAARYLVFAAPLCFAAIQL
jgi:hypothetical protein